MLRCHLVTKASSWLADDVRLALLRHRTQRGLLLRSCACDRAVTPASSRWLRRFYSRCLAARPYATADTVQTGDPVEVQRFRVARRGLAVLMGICAAGGFAIGMWSFTAGEPWWYGSVFLLQAVSLGSMAFIFGRQTVALTDDEIIATQGYQRQRAAWNDVESVHLDWAAEAAGRDRDVLRIERRSATTIRSSATMGMDGANESAEAARLETALRERAAAHGFTVEVTMPSWKARSSDGGRGSDPSG